MTTDLLEPIVVSPVEPGSTARVMTRGLVVRALARGAVVAPLACGASHLVWPGTWRVALFLAVYLAATFAAATFAERAVVVRAWRRGSASWRCGLAAGLVGALVLGLAGINVLWLDAGGPGLDLDTRAARIGYFLTTSFTWLVGFFLITSWIGAAPGVALALYHQERGLRGWRGRRPPLPLAWIVGWLSPLVLVVVGVSLADDGVTLLGAASALAMIGVLALPATLFAGGLVLLDEALLRRFPEVGLPAS